jgi:hypothetical protein
MHMAYFPASARPHWSLPLGFAANYWPGPDVDVVAADGYNAGNCSGAHSNNFLQTGSAMVTPGSMFDPVLAFAKAHGNLPVFIAEWASIPYTSPAVRPSFIRAMQGYVLANPAIKAVMYWDSHGGGNHGNSGPGSAACGFSVNNDPLSLAALAAMNHALHGGLVPAVATPPANTTAHPAGTPAHRTARPARAAANASARLMRQESIAGVKTVSRLLAAGK